jgi:hypothetical protein
VSYRVPNGLKAVAAVIKVKILRALSRTERRRVVRFRPLLFATLSPVLGQKYTVYLGVGTRPTAEWR